MKDERTETQEHEESHLDGRTHANAQTREGERGDVAEPDAPTAAEQNEGMSTILSGNPLTGVQKDASEE
ncbi:MAG TPA: hypothetical protein VGV59_19725 [Pyrinomonadaceae bacterium]|nr:hypothetical protein [Pyrinomonadaceae bacterium]